MDLIRKLGRNCNYILGQFLVFRENLFDCQIVAVAMKTYEDGPNFSLESTVGTLSVSN